MELLPHQYRVVVEKDELDKKITALSAFIVANATFTKCTHAEQARLRSQLYHMQEYSRVLTERISNFE